jgi:hypothetical protein
MNTRSQFNTESERRKFLEHLYGLAGEAAVFLPVPCGKKGPISDGWQNTTREETRTPGYLSRLDAALRRGGNIGVLCGPASGDLCTIDIDVNSEVERFLELNPKLNDALRTRGAKGCQIWVICVGGADAYPARWVGSKLKIPGTTKSVAEWRGGGGHQSIIWGRHPDGMDYRFLVEVPALAVAFSDINWP